MPEPAAPALSGRTVIVSGASSGIGLATARALSSHGARVHGLSRRGGDGPFTPHVCDVTRPADVTRTIDQIAARAGLDAVVLAAGTNLTDRHLGQLSASGWQTLIDTNLSGAFHVFRAALPHLHRSRGDAVFVRPFSRAGAAAGALVNGPPHRSPIRSASASRVAPPIVDVTRPACAVDYAATPAASPGSYAGAPFPGRRGDLVKAKASLMYELAPELTILAGAEPVSRRRRS